MALTVNHPTLKEVTVQCFTTSFGTTPIAGVVRAPFRGTIVKLGFVANLAWTGTLTVTPSIIPVAADAAAPGSGTAITGGAFTMSATNSAPGSSNSIVPTGANQVNEDDIIRFVPSGATATSGTGTFYAVIQVS
jgi:hypothetical protein